MYPIVLMAGAAAACLVFALSLTLHYVTLRARRHPRPVFGVARKAGYHLPHSVAAGVILSHAVLVLALGVVAVRATGAVVPSRVDVRAHLLRLPVSGGGAHGGASTPASVLSLAPAIRDQGNTESCAGQSTTTALMIEAGELGTTFPYANFSGYYDWAFAVGGQNVGTTLDAVAYAEAYHGLVRESRWPQQLGLPPASVERYAYRPGVSYRYLDGSESQAQAALQLGYAPILLIALHSDFYNAFGTSTTDLYGSGFYGNHFITLLQVNDDGSFEVQNSWGVNWGDGGRATLPASSWSQILAVGVVAPGANTAWPNLHTLRPAVAPTATARPTATATPRPRPTATSRPTATATPLSYRVPSATPTPKAHSVARRHGPYWHVTRDQYLRPTPAVDPTSRFLVGRGAQVKAWGSQGSRTWLHVTYKAHTGYLLKSNLR